MVSRRDLLRRYRGTFPHKLDGLRAAQRQLATGGSDAARELRHLAHKLAGSGAAYGFEEITRHATALETGSDEQLPGAVAALIDALEAAMLEEEQ